MSTISKERFNEILREEIARERNKQKELNEIFGLGGLASGFLDKVAKGEGMIGGRIKQKIAAAILKSMGMSDGPAIKVFSQIIQQIDLEDMKTIWKGGAEQCPLATRLIFQGLCQVLGNEIYKKLLQIGDEIPVIGIFSGWLGGGGVLNRMTSGLTSEKIEIQLSDENTLIGAWMHANILPPLEEKVCGVIADFQSKSLVDIALGREGSVEGSAGLGGTDVSPDLDIDADAQNYSFPSS